MKSFYSHREVAESARPAVGWAVEPSAHSAWDSPTALVAVYDALTAPPRVETVVGSSPRDLIERLTALTYSLAHEQGGMLPYTVIREVVENFIHAGFDEVVVSVLDQGRLLRFSDQGPGIRDKERVFVPGFSTATTDMKAVIKGVGSGLPVARECLHFSGGTIEIDDNLGSGTVVTLRMDGPPPDGPPEREAASDDPALPLLTTRQKQVLSLVMEFGSVGPTAVARELHVGLSTAHRDLEHLERHGLITADESGKRALTREGARCLNAILGR